MLRTSRSQFSTTAHRFRPTLPGEVGRNVLALCLAWATSLSACSQQQHATGEELGSANQALGCDGGCVAADGGEGAPCTLTGASTPGLQGDCAAGLWCNLSANHCQSLLLPAGSPIQLPTNTSGCSDLAAWSACASGACNLAHTACGCQVDQDCPAQWTCSGESFECVSSGGVGDAGSTSDAGTTDSAADAATTGSSAMDDAGNTGSNPADDAGSSGAGAEAMRAADASVTQSSDSADDSPSDKRASTSICSAMGPQGATDNAVALAALAGLLVVHVVRRRSRFR